MYKIVKITPLEKGSDIPVRGLDSLYWKSVLTIKHSFKIVLLLPIASGHECDFVSIKHLLISYFFLNKAASSDCWLFLIYCSLLETFQFKCFILNILLFKSYALASCKHFQKDLNMYQHSLQWRAREAKNMEL